MHVVATAGHVDHGKSTLVLALTGMDPDRFAEEKARGLTIDLGFAWTVLPSGRELAFVDVPGHVRFIRNMLAGVGAVDACLFVVAASEGWKPQSEEHLRILELLGAGHGMIALTKVGLVDQEWRQLVELEIEEKVAGTFLEGAEIVAVDTPSGTGLEDVQAALDRLLAATPTAPDRQRPRLWVDRSFAAKGSGTVVTGTLAGGALAVDDELVVLGDRHRGGRGIPVRVRSLQSHQRPQQRVGPGHRLAVNLTGVSHDQVARGHALVRPGQWASTKTFDASIEVLASLDHDVSRRGAYELHVGSGEHPVKLRVLGRESIPAGGHGAVRLRVSVALPLLPGDRYVLRESGRSETVGGGEVLDVAPVLRAAAAEPTRSVERVIYERGWTDLAELERLTGERRPANVGERWVVSAAALEETAAEVRAAVQAAGESGLDAAVLTERQRAVLAQLEGLELAAGRVWLAGQRTQAGADHPWLAALAAAPFSPPEPGGVDRTLVRDFVRQGLVVERDGVYFVTSAVEDAARIIAKLLERQPGGLTVAEVRDALGTTRKHVLPLLAHLDATGVTRRRGDLRIGGPRLPSA